jgi:hypothetical protein
VAGFHTWRRLGRFVRRGEQAIWILAPLTRRVADEDSDKRMRTVVGFRPVAVFAEDQTAGEPLPEVCTRLYGDEPAGAFAELARVAQSFGFAVEDYAFDDETNGDCSHVLRRIAEAINTAGGLLYFGHGTVGGLVPARRIVQCRGRADSPRPARPGATGSLFAGAGTRPAGSGRRQHRQCPCTWSAAPACSARCG